MTCNAGAAAVTLLKDFHHYFCPIRNVLKIQLKTLSGQRKKKEGARCEGRITTKIIMDTKQIQKQQQQQRKSQ